MKTSGLRSIAANASHLTIARVFTQIVRAIYVIVLARYLGPEIYGLFAYGQSWYLAFLPLAALGLGSIICREVGRNRELGGKIVIRALELRILLGVGGAFVCGIIGWVSEGETVTQILLIIFSFALIGRGIANWAEQVFAGYEASRYTLQQEFFFRILEVVIGLIALGGGGRVLAIAFVHAFIWWIQAFRGLYLVHHNLIAIRLKWPWSNLVGLFIQGLPLCLSALFSGWLLQGPLVLYRHVTSDGTDLGQLALVLQALVLLCIVPWSIGMASLPVLSRAVERQDRKDLWFAEGMLRIGFLLGAIAALIAMAFGPSLVQGVFGDRYALAGQMLGPGIWLLIPLTAGTSLAQVFVARGRFIIPCFYALVGSLVLTLSLSILASNFGLAGVLLATGAGLGVWALGLIFHLARDYGLDLSFAVVRPGIAVILAAFFYKLMEQTGKPLALLAGCMALLGAALLFGLLVPMQRTRRKV
ncbi:MAG: oligosaccharide flippase family protein [Pedobacter sp.]